MTNSELKRIAESMERHQQRIRDLYGRIENSDREDKNEIINDLESNGYYNPASATDIIQEYYDK